MGEGAADRDNNFLFFIIALMIFYLLPSCFVLASPSQLIFQEFNFELLKRLLSCAKRRSLSDRTSDGKPRGCLSERCNCFGKTY